MKRKRTVEPIHPNNKKVYDLFHTLWTWAVGKPGYEKRKWGDLVQALRDLQTERITQAVKNHEGVIEFYRAYSFDAVEFERNWPETSKAFGAEGDENASAKIILDKATEILNRDPDPKVVVYGTGLDTYSVCVPKGLSRVEVEDLVNRVNPTGIASRWTVSTDKRFATGETNPCPCEHTAERTHYLMSC